MGTKPLAEITAEALKVLYKEIGIVNTVRFINQYTNGYSDYTREREQLFAGMTLDDIVADIEHQRNRPMRKATKPKKAVPNKRMQPTRVARRART